MQFLWNAVLPDELKLSFTFFFFFFFLTDSATAP